MPSPREPANEERLIPRYRQLACEVLFQVVQDVKALNRRGFLRGLTPQRRGDRRAYQCLGYRTGAEVEEFIDSIRGEPCRAWLKAADINLTHKIFVRKLESLTPETSQPLTANRKEIT
jgi:hypothetical protein